MSNGQGASVCNSFSCGGSPLWACEADRLAGWVNVPIAHWGLYN
jgi:hypothetical protein